MRKRIVPLSDVQVRNAKSREKDFKLSDGQGLYLLVNTAGGRLWRLDYTFAGKRKTLALGSYPSISLADARQRREDARKLLANGVDPGLIKKAQKAAQQEAGENSFEVVAREWHAKFAPTWSDSHAYWVIRRLEQYIFPSMGTRPIAELKAPEVLRLLRLIEDRTLETAHRVKFVLGQVFRYAVGSGRAERDPTADLKGQLAPRSKKHFPTLLDPKEIAGLLRAIDGYKGTFPVKCALKLAPLVFLRPGELRNAEWSEFDLDAGEWNVPAEKLKLKKRIKEERKGQKHLVPLSKQAVAILSDLRTLTGNSPYAFPSVRSLQRPMSENTVNAALRCMGYDTKEDINGHGFRAMARTIIEETLGFRPEIVEHQLAHAVKGPLGRAYNRTTHLEERRKMMQLWSDYLDGLKAGATVLPFKQKTA
ncbi:integrase arm-type DNA-binding domain-containing protein [Geobacter pelophilus]|uniref:Integrase arm-type DNA-binding domain-containing protein n=1 Tax=Geoanaerobacter pelophilus TaxID=60036 RepID=A0AAW4L326_9BACT|nr:integrase arm-type DNA-binding domain-containing protein [Geoanaerobacter pelophilus]MBT0664215.1 integrase arm-type DNA-binding domain-containing protein [Geoanaerobacter pelophilus]